MSLNGTWNISISTQIGRQSAVLELTENDGLVVGVAKNDAETMPLINPVLLGTRLTWKLSITRPLRLYVTFDVIIDGDTLTGTSKAGILPPSRVTGTRVIDK
jgi:hypothetical protein